MRVSEVKFTRKFNLGNYESEEIGIVAVLDEGDDHKKTIRTLKADVEVAFKGEQQGEEDEIRNASGTEDDREDTDDVKDSGPSDDEGGSDEVGTGNTDDDEGDSDASDDEDKESDKKKGGKKLKAKAQEYDRENETHKEIFSGILKDVAPNWNKTPETKAKAKAASTAMSGKEFLDAEGEVLESFLKSVRKLMGKK